MATKTTTSTTKTTKTTTETVREAPLALPVASELLALGLGSNLGDREEHLRRALTSLTTLLGRLRVAPLYRTRAISPIPQPDFLNTVALAQWPARGDLDPCQLLVELKTLEHEAGRRDGPRDGPRPLDLDILLVGDRRISRRSDDPGSRALVVPHPRMGQRRFVLAPLADLAPELRLPCEPRTVRELLSALGRDQQIERVPWSEPPPQGFVAPSSTAPF